MSTKHTVAVLVVLLAAGIGTAYWVFKTTSSQTQPEKSPETLPNSPVAKVQTVLLAHSPIEETIVAYGTVAAAPGKTQTVSVPFESQVRSVLVTPGQVVDANTPLIEIAPSPESRFGLQEARAQRDMANNSLDLVNQRYKMKLATRQDLVSAQQTSQAAQLKVKKLEEQGIDAPQTLLAHARVLVSQINVGQGQIIAPGVSLLEMIDQNQLSVRLGIENEVIDLLKTGQSVGLYRVSAPEQKPIPATIGLITKQVNPQTRMVDVFVVPQAGDRLLLNEYIEGRIIVKSDQGFVVPISAVLPEEQTYILYTVEKDHAVKHQVRVGIKTAQQVQVYGDDLKEGQPVVVSGNYELENNMAVEMEPKQ
jgi:membrane fusion protein (multidrug efflux system)